MTKPTQAQIEAAAKAICESWPKVPDGCAALCMDRLGSIPKGGCRHAVTVHGDRAKTALTAAAQVGEQDQHTKQLLKQIEGLEDKCDKYYKELVNEKEATIERCAQVAEDLLSDISSYPSDPELGAEIAAAIRQLKNEP